MLSETHGIVEDDLTCWRDSGLPQYKVSIVDYRSKVLIVDYRSKVDKIYCGSPLSRQQVKAILVSYSASDGKLGGPWERG